MEEYRIIKALSGFYYVQAEDGVVECRARGRFRRQDQSPLVGDFVRITRQGDKGVLEALLPRKNAFIRPAVANIDQLVVLASCAIPVTEPFLIDRVLAIAQLQNVPALVVVNKDDLAPAQPLAEIYRRAGVPVLVTSAETGEGIEALREALAGKLSCLTGNSGVGKSSLLNRACRSFSCPSARFRKSSAAAAIPRATLSFTAWEAIRSSPIPPASPRSTPSAWSWCTRSSCNMPSRSSLRISAIASFQTAPTGKSPAAPSVRPLPKEKSARPAIAATSACTSWPASSRNGSSNEKPAPGRTTSRPGAGLFYDQERNELA